MSFNTLLNDHFVTTVFVACLLIGYIIKTSIDIIPNKYIPLILTISGAAINTIAIGVSLDSITYGAFMGLASTGAHQAFRQFIDNRNKEE